MNVRQKRRFLRIFLELVEDGELDEAYWEEVCSLLEVQVNGGNKKAAKLLKDLRRILKTSQLREGRIRATVNALREFLVQLLAETAVRLVKRP